MLVSSFLDQYILERSLSRTYVVQLRCTVRLFERWLGRPFEVADFSDQIVNRWLLSLETDVQASRHTIHSQRGNLLVLWRAAAVDGHTDVFPRRVRRVQTPEIIPHIWDEAETHAWLLVCRKIPGFCPFSGAKLSRLWVAYSLTVWDSSLRPSDAFQLERRMIPPDGRFTVVQRKTGKRVTVQLRPETIAEIDATGAGARKYIWPFFEHPKSYWWRQAKLVKLAGLTGSPAKCLRRGSITDAEAQQDGGGQKQGGHSNPGTTWKYYIRRDKLPDDRPRPRPLIVPPEVDEDQNPPRAAG